MGYIYSALASFAVAMLAFVLQSVIRENRELKREKDEEHANRENALENGVVCLLRVKLIEYHAKYTELEYISANGLQNWLLMHKAYKALGGNGMIDHMKEEVENLHIKN